MENLLKIPSKLLNYDACSKDICQVDGINRRVSPYSVIEIEKEFRNEYVKARDFLSPLYSIGSKYDGPAIKDADGVIFTKGGEKNIDFRWWRKTYYISKWANSYSPNKCVISLGDAYCRKEIRFEDEIELLRIDERDSVVAKNYDFYINNYYENVKIEGTDKAKNNHLFFRAPQPNEERADGKLVRLTEAPRFNNDGSRRDEFWSKPITLHSAAVTYVEEIELNCYESHQYKGSRLYLIGLLPKELSEKDKRFFCEGIPYVDVWESPELVVKKLKDAGWGK
jgi:hypothetical protein